MHEIKGGRGELARTVPTARVIRGVIPDSLLSYLIETNEHLSRQIDLLCVMLTSLLIMGIQMGEMSKLGWLIGSMWL
jgi:hypothetical protein